MEQAHIDKYANKKRVQQSHFNPTARVRNHLKVFWHEYCLSFYKTLAYLREQELSFMKSPTSTSRAIQSREYLRDLRNLVSIAEAMEEQRQSVAAWANAITDAQAALSVHLERAIQMHHAPVTDAPSLVTLPADTEKAPTKFTPTRPYNAATWQGNYGKVEQHGREKPPQIYPAILPSTPRFLRSRKRKLAAAQSTTPMSQRKSSRC
ncbi:MAG: hypothetical protein U0Y68_23895 [Blastocatellia bacterium]